MCFGDSAVGLLLGLCPNILQSNFLINLPSKPMGSILGGESSRISGGNFSFLG
jgi:hypothetical protein